MVDKNKVKQGITLLLEAIEGKDAHREGLRNTPGRVAKAYAEMLDGYDMKPEDVLNPENPTFDAERYDEMIIRKDIKIESMCEHHLLSFTGRAWIGYIPNKRIIGLSKIDRIVRIYSHRLQVQERMTTQIADALEKILKPQGIMVVIEASHNCMMLRGIRSDTGITVTSAVRGKFKKFNKTKMEFLSLIHENNSG